METVFSCNIVSDVKHALFDLHVLLHELHKIDWAKVKINTNCVQKHFYSSVY